MTLTAWRKKYNIKIKELSDMAGYSFNHINNLGSKEVSELSMPMQKSLELIVKVKELQGDIKSLKVLIRMNSTQES